MNIVNKSKNNAKPNSKLVPESDESQQEELQVSGLTAGTGQPNMEFASDEQDMDLIDQLYSKPKHKPLMGEGAYWNDWE